MRSSVRLLCVATVLAVSGAGCVTHPAARPAPITDAVVDADLRRYETQQAAIASLNDAGQRVASYSLAKAQCWLDVSFHEYTRNDRSPFPDQAFQQSALITDYLQGGGATTAPANPALQTPLVNQARRLRPDLWQRAATLKGMSGYRCAERQIACAEVELVHAGNEYNQQQWNHAQPYVQIAEDLVSGAEQSARDCPAAAGEVAAAPPSAPAAPAADAGAIGVAAPVPAPATPVTERYTLLAQALFGFDRRGVTDLRSEGRAQLDALIARLGQVYASVSAIHLTGHADRLGAEDYNLKLSIDRANAVRAYLMAHGLTAPISTEGRSSREPLTHCKATRSRRALHRCLLADRRVEVAVTGIPRSQ